MNYKELRIGNAIMHQGDMVTADSMSDSVVIIIRHGEIVTSYFDEINPIPLTPELLERAGFVKQFGYWQRHEPHFDMFSIWEYDNDFEVILNDTLVTRVAHLHQLQNLYYALTGEELNVEI